MASGWRSCQHNSARLLTALFGVSGSGRILVPINFRLVAEEVKYIVAPLRARGCCSSIPSWRRAWRTSSARRSGSIGAETDAVLMRFDVEPRPWDPDEDATATINYTSGTTARPKGVQLTHRNIWLNATMFGWHMGVNDRDVYLHTLPQFHCNGWGMLYAVTGMGGKHVILRKVDGAEILRRVDEHGVTLMCGAPAVLNMILDAAATWDGADPGRGRTRIVVAGAPPPTRTIERFETELGWEFVQIYGLTETTPVLTMNRTRGRVGRPRRRRSGGEAQPRRRAGDRMHDGGQRPGRGARPRQHGDGGLLGPTRGDRRGHPRRLVLHR